MFLNNRSSTYIFLRKVTHNISSLSIISSLTMHNLKVMDKTSKAQHIQTQSRCMNSRIPAKERKAATGMRSLIRLLHRP